MNKKRIDEVLKAAFGEGELRIATDAERAELRLANRLRDGLSALKEVPEHQLSNERLREAIYARMTPAERRQRVVDQAVFDGLQTLRDVPEHQLSNERLRNAILGSGVRPRRVNLWGYAAAGIACLAVAAIFFRGDFQPKPDPVHVALNDAPRVAPGADATLGLSGEETPMVRRQPEAATTRPDPPTTTVNPESVSPDYHTKLADGFGAVISNAAFGQENEVEVAPAALDAGPKEVVVVDPASRTRNGAAAATEVASYGDVVIGG